MAIAQTCPIEIVSVDSALVYVSMDIGTAKPIPPELATVPHHLINIRDPLHAYSAAQFVNDASALICDIAGRGKLPLLVGGTMLYLKALRHGLDDMPCADAVVRQAIEAEADQKGWAAMHAELAQIDPITAARLAPADSQRISRALEVFRISGKPLASFQKSNLIAPYAAAAGADAQIASETTQTKSLLISLEPTDRTWLHQRIAKRFDTMLSSGFLDEVKALRTRGDLHPDLPSMRCVGYRQAWEALDGLWPMTQLRDKGIFATRQLAKRQITWLRSMPERQVIACDASDALTQVLALTRRFISRMP
jgi:tRNA dimethylallyltransferase